MEIKYVSSPDMATPGGHYSHGVVYNGLVFVAGQLAIAPNGEHRTSSIEEQTEQALQNVAEVLKAAGSDLSRVLKMTIYVTDISLWGQVNAVYARVMGDLRPARAVIPVKDLHHDFQIEIEAIAAAGE